YNNVETYKHLDYCLFINVNFEMLNQRRSKYYGYLTKSRSTWVDPPGYYQSLQADNKAVTNGLGMINSDIYIVGDDSGTELKDGLGYFIIAILERVLIKKTVHDVAEMILKLINC
ncbi:hypothetical protein HK098_006569, partial [Nowakowskiella sp. JEL0407]